MKLVKTCSALFTVFMMGAAASAFAQTPAPMVAPAGPEVAAAPTVQASDDMTGALGLGVGIVAGDSLIKPDPTITVKYWMHDDLVIVPQFRMSLSKARTAAQTESGPASWQFNPQVMALMIPWKTTSTRLSVGGGLGLNLSKVGGSDNTTVGITIPIYAGLEHFFTRWFSMSIGIANNFFSYEKTGDVWNLGVSVDSLSYLGSLMFYTD